MGGRAGGREVGREREGGREGGGGGGGEEVYVMPICCRFKKEEWEKLSSQLSKIALFRYWMRNMNALTYSKLPLPTYRTLFLSEFHTFSSCTNEEMLDIFQR